MTFETLLNWYRSPIHQSETAFEIHGYLYSYFEDWVIITLLSPFTRKYSPEMLLTSKQ